MTPIKKYLQDGEELENKFECKKLRNKVARYTLIDGELYRHSITLPYLKCLTEDEAEHALCEPHEGVCRNHLVTRKIAHKLLKSDIVCQP